MDKNKKTLIIVGSIAALCIVCVIAGVLAVRAFGRMASRMVVTDPAEVAQAAHQIADYDLPPGYSEQMVMNILTMRYVVIAPVDNVAGLVIMLAQFPEGSDTRPEDLAEQLSQSYDQPGMSGGEYHVVDSKMMTIRGVETEVVTSETTMGNGLVMRQLVTIFPGKSGQAMLMIQGAVEQWNDTLVENFIRSIR